MHLSPFNRRLSLLLPALSIALILPAAIRAQSPPAKPPAGEAIGPEVGGTAQAFLNFVQNGNEEALRGAPGLNSAVVTKILKHRASGAKFKNLIEFKRVTGILPQDLEAALAPYAQIDRGVAIEQMRKPVVEAGKGTSKAGRTRTAESPAGAAPEAAKGELPPPPAPKGDGPIGHVRAGWYAKLPGYDDLDKLDPTLRNEFLERVNNEMCQCGCQNETLAFCLVNDPGCPVVKGRVRKIYDDITRQPAR